MKKLLLFASLIALFCSSCSNKDEAQGVDDTQQKASMTIKLAGSGKSQTKATGPVTQAEENVIHSYMVYVFYNGVLEKRTNPILVDPDTPDYTYTLQGLTTGAKEIVVIANKLNYPLLNVGDSFSRFAEAGFNIDLDDQASLSNGLIMTGKATTTLAASPATNEVTVPISRIVAKIKLGSITVEPAVGTNPASLNISGVAIMDAPSLASLGLPSPVVTTPPLYGGIAGGLNVIAGNVKPYLFESIVWDGANAANNDYSDRFFYVFPDQQDAPDYPTYMVLQATYNGNTGYFVFAVDHILRNTEHTLNVTLKRIASGSPDPDVPSEPTTLEVTVEAQDWIVQLPQNVEW